MLGPLLYILYTSDLPTSRDTKLGTFADDTAIFATMLTPQQPQEISRNTSSPYRIGYKNVR
jgi:hypothetical protein